MKFEDLGEDRQRELLKLSAENSCEYTHAGTECKGSTIVVCYPKFNEFWSFCTSAVKRNAGHHKFEILKR